MDNKRLIELRNILKVSQAKLARLFNVSTTFLSEIEKGQRPFQSFMIDKIVSAYGIREKWLKEGILPIFNNETENQRIANTIDLAVNIKNQLGSMKLQELAEQMNITYPAIRGIMSTGRCSKERLDKISEILKVPESEFTRTLDNQLIKEKMSNNQSISIGDNSKFTNNVFGDFSKNKEGYKKALKNDNEDFNSKEIITILLRQIDALNLQNLSWQKQVAELNSEIKILYKKLLKKA